MDSHRLLIVGAGKAGSEAIQRALERPDSLGEPIAIADDDERKIGASIRGVPVRGAIGDIPQIVRNCAITDILIALPSVHGERLQEIIGICKRTHCYVRLLRLTDEGTSCERLFAREPDISDFLSRPGMRVNDERIRAFVENRTVLITGGAGSLGAELIRQLLPYHPGKIIAFDISDNYAAELETELRRRFGAFLPVDFEIGSVCDKKRVDEVFRACRPDIVLHAAAHKHISLAESSPAEAVQTNVFGLINALDAARTTQCDSFVLLSSECAVNPVSVLGACARVCEDLISLYAEKNSMNAFTVRFGNVLASHGSVLPLLVKQIHNGGPVTLTNPDAERYFITLSEAAQLILEASAAGHRGQTYVLDMGSPMKVRDLALRLIRFCGLEPDTDIPIQTTNLRPGEKLYSEMYTEAEAIRLSQTDNDRILGMQSSLPDHSVSEETLTALRTERTPEKIRELLQTLVPSYHPAQ